MFYFEVVEDVLFLRGENFGCYFDGLRSNGGCCACVHTAIGEDELFDEYLACVDVRSANGGCPHYNRSIFVGTLGFSRQEKA